MGTDVIYQGARSAVGLFFLYGAKALQPIPPLDPSRGMSAAILMTMAIVLWLTVEFFDVYFRRFDPTRRRRKKPQRRDPARDIVSNLVQEILSALGMASTNRGASGRNHSRRK